MVNYLINVRTEIGYIFSVGISSLSFKIKNINAEFFKDNQFEGNYSVTLLRDPKIR